MLERLRTVPGGSPWLSNFRRCLALGFFGAKTGSRLEHALRVAVPVEASGAELLKQVRLLLPTVATDVSHTKLKEAFQAAFPDSFPVARVVTQDTFENYHTIDQSQQNRGHTSRLQQSVDDREPEFLPPALATLNDVSPRAKVLKPSITLAPPDGLAFVTDLDGWQLRSGDGEHGADSAMLWLGLSYQPGTRLVALAVTHGLQLIGADCRRPTLIDAGNHPWWFCWPDDPPHLGHTIDLSKLHSTQPVRGAKEWVVKPVQISTDGGAVEVQYLGQTTVDTDGANEAMYSKFEVVAGV